LKVSAILLAAGLSKRMGKDKLFLDYRGKTILQHSVDLLSILPVEERIIVTTKSRIEYFTEKPEEKIKNISAQARDSKVQIYVLPDIKLCVNLQPENGLSSSIRTGIQTARGTHYFFLAADQPRLTKFDLIPMLEAAEANPDKIIFPGINSKPGSPAIFPAFFRSDLLNLKGDNGGRIIRDKNKALCMMLETENPENFMDVDNTEDYNGLF